MCLHEVSFANFISKMFRSRFSRGSWQRNRPVPPHCGLAHACGALCWDWSVLLHIVFLSSCCCSYDLNLPDSSMKQCYDIWAVWHLLAHAGEVSTGTVLWSLFHGNRRGYFPGSMVDAFKFGHTAVIKGFSRKLFKNDLVMLRQSHETLINILSNFGSVLCNIKSWHNSTKPKIDCVRVGVDRDSNL